jgi:exodeoxyribonuclease VII large subunit
LATAQQRFDRAGERLGAALIANLRLHRSALDRASAALRPAALRQEIARRGDRARQAGERLAPAMQRALQDKSLRLANAARLLETLSHKSALARGFALVRDADGRVISAGGDLAAGQSVTLTFKDGDRAAVIDGAGEAAPKRKGKPTAPGGDQGSLF